MLSSKEYDRAVIGPLFIWMKHDEVLLSVQQVVYHGKSHNPGQGKGTILSAYPDMQQFTTGQSFC